MHRRIVIGLLRVSAIAVFLAMVGSEAIAACSTSKISGSYCVSWQYLYAGGPKFCALWCTGSAQVDIVLKAQDGSDIKTCTASAYEFCPEVTASAFGTVTPALEPPVPSPGCEDPLNPSLDLRCAIQGYGFCLPPGCDPGHKNDPDCKNFESNGTPMQLQGGLTQSGIFTSGNCTQNGTCSLSFKLKAEQTNEFCPNANWVFDFIPKTFNALVEYCPGGTGKDPVAPYGDVCCASTDRIGAFCKDVFFNSEDVRGEESRNLQRCNLTQDPPTLGQPQDYTCTNLLVPAP